MRALVVELLEERNEMRLLLQGVFTGWFGDIVA